MFDTGSVSVLCKYVDCVISVPLVRPCIVMLGEFGMEFTRCGLDTALLLMMMPCCLRELASVLQTLHVDITVERPCEVYNHISSELVSYLLLKSKCE